MLRSTPAPPAAALQNCTASATAGTEAQQFLSLINDYRAQHGIGPLALSATLSRSAAWKSQHMADNNYFAHDDTPIGRTWVQRLRDCGYTYNTWLGENIAAGNEYASGTLDQWKNSPAHNSIMLNANFAAIGIARASNDSSQYTWYWTADFGGTVDAPPPAPTATPAPTPTPYPTVVLCSTSQTDGCVDPYADSDGDGCTDARELGGNPVLGGLRDPDSFWDVYDVPTGAAMTRDGSVSSLDLLAVLARFNSDDDGGTAVINRWSDPLSPPPASGYHPAFDRGGLVGAYAWNIGPPNGAISGTDLFAALLQFGHTCR